jgi:hypothetical protein
MPETPALRVQHVWVDIPGGDPRPGIVLGRDRRKDGSWWYLVTWAESDPDDPEGAPIVTQRQVPAAYVRPVNAERPPPDPVTGRPQGEVNS